MDYRTWRFSRKERLRYGLEALAVTGILAFCFYNSPWALAVFPLTAFWYFREKGEQLAEERRKELKLQFRDAVQGMAAALAAGYSAENAIREAGRDLRLVYPESADMVQELAAMQRKLDANQTVEEVIRDFASRSGLEEAETFSEIFAVGKRSGGDLIAIMKDTARTISQTVDTERQAASVLASRRYSLCDGSLSAVRQSGLSGSGVWERRRDCHNDGLPGALSGCAAAGKEAAGDRGIDRNIGKG